MSSLNPVRYSANFENALICDRLYRLYQQQYDAFGGVDKSADLSELMKELLCIREEQTRSSFHLNLPRPNYVPPTWNLLT